MDIIQTQTTMSNATDSSFTDDESDIQKFYSGANVFITGGTGFMGKVLVEKLLRSTNVAALYLLVREKKGKTMRTRMDELFEDNFFQRLRNEVPKWRYRVIGVPGDCSVAGLGLSIFDRQTLIKNVNVVFHAAATVRFDEKLKLAFAINVRGTKDVLDLCKQMKHLKSMMHVSTAYSNCHMDTQIDECFYQYATKPEDMGVLLDKMDDKCIEELLPKILGKWPNTYTFTKALAESLIQEQAAGLPLGVFRPAIVISTYKEPIPGWINNLYGPTGVAAGVFTGVLRVMRYDDNVVANIVPVDLCVCGLIAGAWDVGTKKSERTVKNVPIYNYVSTNANPITYREYNALNMMFGFKYPSNNSVWALYFKTVSSKGWYTFYKYAYHIVPALIFDTLAALCGQKPRLLGIYRKIHKFSDVLAYFCTRDWEYADDNVTDLWHRLSVQDKRLFPFSMKELPWQIYFRTYISGMREHLLKDPLTTIPAAKKRLNRLIILHGVIKYILTFLSAQALISLFYRFLKLASIGY